MESNMSADDIVVARKRSAKECSMIEEEVSTIRVRMSQD